MRTYLITNDRGQRISVSGLGMLIELRLLVRAMSEADPGTSYCLIDVTEAAA